MAEKPITSLSRSAMASTVASAAEAAVTAAGPGIAASGAERIAIGALQVRVPHRATGRDVSEAIRLALRERAP